MKENFKRMAKNLKGFYKKLLRIGKPFKKMNKNLKSFSKTCKE
jgi:hypothetical protein